MTSDIVHCFCRGFEAGGGQCDPEQKSNFGVYLRTPNDYHCMLTLPQSFLENVVVLTYLNDEHSYVDLNLLCKIWKKMPKLETVIMSLSSMPEEFAYPRMRSCQFLLYVLLFKTQRFQCMLSLPSFIHS